MYICPAPGPNEMRTDVVKRRAMGSGPMQGLLLIKHVTCLDHVTACPGSPRKFTTPNFPYHSHVFLLPYPL